MVTGKYIAGLILVVCMLSFGTTRAESKVQLVFKKEIAPDVKADIMVTALPEAKEKAEQDFLASCDHARKILENLDPLDPASESSALLSKPTVGTFEISPDLANILEAARTVAEKRKDPLAKKFKVDLNGNRFIIKKEGWHLDIEPYLKGYLADNITADMAKAGWQDTFLELDGVYIARGEDFNGPWKIPVVDNTPSMARRAFFFKAKDTAAATVNGDRAGDDIVKRDLKSVTVFSSNAAEAKGLAAAAYSLTLGSAKKELNRAEIKRAVLINSEGKFVHIPEK